MAKKFSIQRLFSSFRTNLLSGIFALTPIGVVLWIALWFWQILQNVRSLLPESLDPKIFLGPEYPVLVFISNGIMTVLIFTLIVISIAGFGLASRNILGKRMLAILHTFVDRIPILRTVYSTLEQLLETFSTGQAKNFRKVVLIEYPRKGIYTLALVTGERQQNPATGSAERFLNIFVPTTPNPTSGFYLTIPASEAKELPITVEEALKQIISMGIVH